MKYLIGLCTVLLVVTGCQAPDPEIIEEVDTVATKSESVVTGKVGESCGKAGDKLCASGLECKFNNDDIGTCALKALALGVTCGKEREPVCGQKGRNQVAYLNACEARRHGARVVYDGLCELDDTVIENCGSKVLSIGNCGQKFTGFEYSLTEKNCETVTVRGCELQSPFRTIESCSTACIKR